MDEAAFAVGAVEAIATRARERLRATLAAGGRAADREPSAHQLGAHALAQLWAELCAARLLLGADPGAGAALAAELLLAARSSIALGPIEAVPLSEVGVSLSEVAELVPPATIAWAERAAGQDAMMALAERAQRDGASPPPLGDDALDAMRAEMRRFADREVGPCARAIHDRDELVPMALCERLGELGVFGLTTAKEHGGLGLGRLAMCVVTEELARRSLGVASVGTRAEIAADLIARSGTPAQQRALLPAIAAGKTLPTAAFSEPDHGSDLAHATTRATRLPGGGFAVFGQKAWTTHAARADLLTLLVRTGADPGHAGLSILLAPKTRRQEPPEFVDAGLSGSETKVLGYRGMKEYTLHFDGFYAPEDALLGGEQGAGFKQLMATFETARIQTAARAVGVAQAALDLALGYAKERRQFGRAIIGFPRIARKIAAMVVRVGAARVLTHHAARKKDQGVRCDLEAGMAKLVATRAAWDAADQCVQIHGGMGYALECDASRLLCDARVLSLFEGTSEIQAEVVARRLLEAPAGGGP